VKDSVNLEVLINFNSFSTVLQVFKRFPLVKPLQYLFAPFGKIALFAQMEKATRDSVLHRIGTYSHLIRLFLSMYTNDHIKNEEATRYIQTTSIISYQ
jgi:hypothetical protein